MAGGAAAIRANGPDTIREMREALAVPILGINKVDRETNEVYITPTPEAAEEVIRAGADFIAVDCTGRPRPDGRSTSGGGREPDPRHCGEGSCPSDRRRGRLDSGGGSSGH